MTAPATDAQGWRPIDREMGAALGNAIAGYRDGDTARAGRGLADAVYAMREAEAAYPPWRPMADARDDEPILGHLPGYGSGSMFWQTVVSTDGREVSGWRIHGMLIPPDEAVQPDAWMPLPPPPQVRP